MCRRSFRHLPHCVNLLPSAVLLFIFLLPRGKKKRGGKEKLFISKGIGTHPSKENAGKREKRILCKSSEGFQNLPFLPIINTRFPFALSSPLWHSWYISLSIITNFKAPPPRVILQNPLDWKVMAWAAFIS